MVWICINLGFIQTMYGKVVKLSMYRYVHVFFVCILYYYIQASQGIWMLDTSTPGQIGTCVRHFGTKTNRHPDNSAPQLDKSALVFFSLILRTEFLIAFNLVIIALGLARHEAKYQRYLLHAVSRALKTIKIHTQ